MYQAKEHFFILQCTYNYSNSWRWCFRSLSRISWRGKKFLESCRNVVYCQEIEYKPLFIGAWKVEKSKPYLDNSKVFKREKYIWTFMNGSGRLIFYFIQIRLQHFRDGKNGILLPKLFWPTARKNCSIETVKDQNNFW